MFEIVIDTREKEPYSFACPSARRKLHAGDYSVAGHEHVVTVERKSLTDFSHTVVHDGERFAAELEKLKRFAAACVVVEADLDRLLHGEYAGELRGIAPMALLGFALRIIHRQGIPIFWCGSRPASAIFTEQYLRMFVRAKIGEFECPKP